MAGPWRSYEGPGLLLRGLCNALRGLAQRAQGCTGRGSAGPRVCWIVSSCLCRRRNRGRSRATSSEVAARILAGAVGPDLAEATGAEGGKWSARSEWVWPEPGVDHANFQGILGPSVSKSESNER